MTPRTTTAEDGAYVQWLGCAHFSHLCAVIEDLSPTRPHSTTGRRHAGQLRRLLLLARAVTQSQTANDRDQPDRVMWRCEFLTRLLLFAKYPAIGLFRMDPEVRHISHSGHAVG